MKGPYFLSPIFLYLILKSLADASLVSARSFSLGALPRLKDAFLSTQIALFKSKPSTPPSSKRIRPSNPLSSPPSNPNSKPTTENSRRQTSFSPSSSTPKTKTPSPPSSPSSTVFQDSTSPGFSPLSLQQSWVSLSSHRKDEPSLNLSSSSSFKPLNRKLGAR